MFFDRRFQVQSKKSRLFLVSLIRFRERRFCRDFVSCVYDLDICSSVAIDCYVFRVYISTQAEARDEPGFGFWIVYFHVKHD